MKPLTRTITYILIILLALTTITLLENRSLWVDEAYSWATTQQPLTFYIAEHPISFLLSILFFLLAALIIEHPSVKHKWLLILTTTSSATLLLLTSGVNPKDAHPFLYYILLTIWTKLFGTSTIGLRSLSSLAIILAFLALNSYLKKYHTNKVRILTLLIFSISSTIIHYSTETRQYALLILLGIIAHHQLRRVIDEKKTPTAYIITITLMCYLHYYAILLVIAHFLIMLAKKTPWATIKKTYGITAMTCIPLLTYFIAQKARIINMYLKPPTTMTWLSSIGFSINYADNLQANLTNTLYLAAALLILTLITASAILRRDKWALPEYLILTTPQVVAILIAITYFTYHPRYFLWAAFLAPVLIATSIMHANKTHPRIASATIIGVLATTLIITSLLLLQPSTELRDAATLIKNDCPNPCHATIMHETIFSSLPTHYYLPTTRNLWLTNYTREQRQSMAGDTTPTSDVITTTQTLPAFIYYLEHDHELNTENMTLLKDIGGLRVWKQNH